jgi:hypothetical protein
MALISRSGCNALNGEVMLRGLSERRVILKYPVRAALNPLVSTIGYLLPCTVSGSAPRGPAPILYDRQRQPTS